MAERWTRIGDDEAKNKSTAPRDRCCGEEDEEEEDEDGEGEEDESSCTVTFEGCAPEGGLRGERLRPASIAGGVRLAMREGGLNLVESSKRGEVHRREEGSGRVIENALRRRRRMGEGGYR